MTLFLLSAGIICLLGTGTPPAKAGKLPFSRTRAAERFGGTLTFAERVGYQYAIEEVYWRHRIWPKDNPVPKPSLDAIASQREIEKKVEDYLRKSQIVTDKRVSPITASELESEMERMAQHTKQPDVLRELFAALGNDPFVIAECLARPILVERMSTEGEGGSSALPLDGKVNREAIANSRPSVPITIARGAVDPPDAAYKLPEISVPLDCTGDDAWAATTTVNAPDAREYHTAVWTGSEMIIWGGFNFSSGVLNTGARYNPTTDSWIATSIADAPTSRTFHTAVWIGSEMIIWGGYSNGNDLNSGGRYNPTTDTWIPTSTANAPIGRESHTAAWAGNEMIVWGGVGCGSNCNLNTGGRYNPATDGWIVTNTTNAPVARFGHRALWTGSEMIVWGGTDRMNYLHTGGRYNPASDSWTATGLVNVPLGRDGHTAVWTGNEMIIWGGVDENFNDTNTGGRYNPSTDSWTPTGLGLSPRDSHSAVWTGNQMIIWGGYWSLPHDDVNTGGRYNPSTDSWTPTTTTNAPLARENHTAVWTGNEMIVWGGFSIDVNFELNTGERYCAQPSTPIVQSAVSRKTHGNAGSFGVDLPLSGTPGIECRSGGGTSDYTIVVTFLANVSVNGNPQAAVPSGIGSIGSGGVSDGGMVTVSGNVVTIPLTNVASAQTIQVTLNNVNGSTNVMIPMRVLIGDVNGNGAVNASDVALTKSRIGQAVNVTNFRSDVNAGGGINATDVSIVKSMIGTGLP